MSVARASRRRRWPPPASTVLYGDRCDHGELITRCALCRLAAEPPDDQDTPPPATPRPTLTLVADAGDEDEPELAVRRGWDR